MWLGLIDTLGFAAAFLTLATFAQRSMLPMRIMAIGANVCFIGYGLVGFYMPVLLLHLVLLPLNLARLGALLAGRDREGRARALPPPGTSSGLI